MREKKEMKEGFFKKRKMTIAIIIAVIVIIALVFVAVEYMPTGKVKSEDQAREEIMDISKEIGDLSSTIESIDEELK